MARASTTINRSSDEAVIGKGAHVRGRISGSGDLRVQGIVAGDVAIEGDLTIAEGGEITADVQATSVVVEGGLEGDIIASRAVSIGKGARVAGNIRGDGVSIEEGAQLAGQIDQDFELPAELTSKTGR